MLRLVPSSLAALLAMLQFLSRLPLPAGLARRSVLSPEDFSRAFRFAPLIGALLALAPAAVLVLASEAGLPPLVASLLAFAVLTLETGALHEDGLADVADGFGGGATRERKLDIMRDSRIGSFGTLALAGSVLLRVAALASILGRDGLGGGVLSLLAVAAWSRGLMLVPLAWLPPARADGLARDAGKTTPATLTAALLWGGTFACLPMLLQEEHARQVLAVLVLSPVAACAMAALARRQIGGVTGDVVGATQQLAEIAAWIGLCSGSMVG